MRATGHLRSLQACRCVVPALILLGSIQSAQAQTRTVKLSVSVVDTKKQDVPGATVTISTGSGSPMTVQSGANGTTTADIPVGTGGWFSSDPVLTIQASKDGSSGIETLNVRSKAS